LAQTIPPRRPRAVLSDLDDTLFDHAATTRDALAELRADVPAFARWTIDDLDRAHRRVLDRLHVDVLAGRDTIEGARMKRFRELLVPVVTPAEKPALDTLAQQSADRYRRAYERHWRSVPGASALAQALRARGLPLVIVTNNNEREQQLKLERTQLTPYVHALVTSERIGVTKPGAAIFHAALDHAGVTIDDAVMLGDAWPTDIEGACALGLRAVWFNRFGESRAHPHVTEIQSLEPLADVLRALGLE
jgi:HAD superfamily hydrolase (TIGR01549 family)